MEGLMTTLERNAAPTLGILSSKLIRSPVIQWILPARLRSQDRHEIAMIGEDFVHVKEIDTTGRLCHLTTIDTFDSRIRSGSIIGTEARFTLHPPFELSAENIKIESESEQVPPQFMVLCTADPPELHFLIVKDKNSVPLTFHERIRPLPNPGDQTIHQLGSLIAVDPQSRAFAVAAAADHLIVYRLKNLQKLGQTYLTDPDSWDPVQEEQILRVKGTILRMHFLEVGNKTPDRLALVLVVGLENRVTIQWYIWDLNGGNRSMFDSLLNSDQKPQIHRLSTEYSTPQLLIPSQYSPYFLMLYQDCYVKVTGIMSGSLQITPNIDYHLGPDDEPRYPASSAKLPVWTGWSRAINNVWWGTTEKERFFIVREDGIMYHFTIEPQSTQSNNVGSFGGFVDGAFACCEVDTTLRKPFYMVSAGSMSPGEVKQIGRSGVAGSFPIERRDNTRPDTVDTIDNWSPTNDMILADLGRGSQAGSFGQPTSIYTTAGRGPNHGSIVEMNKGYAAHVDTQFSHELFASATKLWALTDRHDSFFIIASLPAETLLFHLPLDFSEVTEMSDEAGCGLVTDQSTILLAVLHSGHIIQITSTDLLILKIDDNTLSKLATVPNTSPAGSRIICAAVDSKCALALIASHSAQDFTIKLVEVGLPSPSSGHSISDERVGSLTRLEAEPTAVALFECAGSFYAAVGTADGTLHVFQLESGLNLRHVLQHFFTQSSHGGGGSSSICESLTTIQKSTPGANDRNGTSCTILCGMRSGTVVAIDLSGRLSNGESRNGYGPNGTSAYSNSSVVQLDIKAVVEQHLGLIPVNLVAHDSLTRPYTYATCGSNIFRISFASNARSLTIDEVILTPRSYLSKYGVPVRALAHVVLTEDPDTYGSTIAVVNGDDITIANVGDQIMPVPLTFGLGKTTPNYVLHCERLSALVVASTKIKLAREIPRTVWSGKRVTYAQIELISTTHSFDDGRPLRLGKFKLWPGERINSILDWKFRDSTGTKHGQLVVGTGLYGAADPPKGRLVFLNTRKDDESGSIIIEPTKVGDYSYPVKSVAALSDRDLVIATGQTVQVLRLTADSSGARLAKLCRHELRSPGIHITTEAPFIHVSTANDSLLVFQLVPRERDGQIEDESDETDHEPTTSTAAEELRLIFTDSQAKDAIHHLPLSIDIPQDKHGGDRMDTDAPPSEGSSRRNNVILLSDRDCCLTGFYVPPLPMQGTAMPTLFEAQLPRSLMRIRQGSVRPSWHRRLDAPGMESVLADDLLGAAIDGEIYQFSIVDGKAWKVLKMMESLAKTKDTLRLETAGRYVYPNDEYAAMTLNETDEIEDKTRYHIDGDLLARYATRNEDTMIELLGLMRHRRYRGPDEGVFAEAVKDLLGLHADVEEDQMLEQLHAWYLQVMMPML